jgi:hypothetical protein
MGRCGIGRAAALTILSRAIGADFKSHKNPLFLNVMPADETNRALDKAHRVSSAKH